MKPRGYHVRIEPGSVIVEHRAYVRLRTALLLSLAYIGFCLLSDIREVLISFYNSPDLGTGFFAVFLMTVPFAGGITWLYFASGEVMRCDAHEVHIAQRRLVGRWRRHRYESSQIRQLQTVFRGGSKSRSYTVLTFQYVGRTVDMLEDLPRKDTIDILTACKAIGIDAVIMLDPGEAMLRDIDERGWWVNPFKPDRRS